MILSKYDNEVKLVQYQEEIQSKIRKNLRKTQDDPHVKILSLYARIFY